MPLRNSRSGSANDVARPAETHTGIAGHVDDEASGREIIQVVVGREDQRVRRTLEDAVDGDVVVGQCSWATGMTPSSGVSTQVFSGGASSSCPIWMIWVGGIGAATAATSRLVSTRTRRHRARSAR